MVRPRRFRPERPDELDRRLRERLAALGPAPRAELLHALMFRESAADRIGGYGSAASTARLAELFEDAQRNSALRAVLVGMLREAERGR